MDRKNFVKTLVGGLVVLPFINRLIKTKTMEILYCVRCDRPLMMADIRKLRDELRAQKLVGTFYPKCPNCDSAGSFKGKFLPKDMVPVGALQLNKI